MTAASAASVDVDDDDDDSDEDDDFDLFDDIKEVFTEDESKAMRIEQILAPTESENALLVPPNLNSYKLGKLIEKDPLDVLQ